MRLTVDPAKRLPSQRPDAADRVCLVSGCQAGGNSVRGWLGLEFLNLVLEGQLASLQVGDFESIDGWMQHRRIDLPLDIAVLPAEFVKMGCKRHDWFSLSWFPRLQPPPMLPAHICDGWMTLCHQPGRLSNA
jgi:hypothetical protein